MFYYRLNLNDLFLFYVILLMYKVFFEIFHANFLGFKFVFNRFPLVEHKQKITS